jgi:hypothetical protein
MIQGSKNRYWFDKLFKEAMTRRMMSRVTSGPGCRGFFVSICYTPVQLGTEIIKKMTVWNETNLEAKKAGQNIADFRKMVREQDKEQTPKPYPFLKAV